MYLIFDIILRFIDSINIFFEAKINDELITNDDVARIIIATSYDAVTIAAYDDYLIIVIVT